MVGVSFLYFIMGNVVSTVLMYALQAVWFCQRMIDKDFSQNYGSRQECIKLKPKETVDVFLEKHSSTPKLSRSPHRQSVLISSASARTSSLPNYYKTERTQHLTHRRTSSLKHRVNEQIFKDFSEPRCTDMISSSCSSSSSSDDDEILQIENRLPLQPPPFIQNTNDVIRSEQTVLEWIDRCKNINTEENITEEIDNIDVVNRNTDNNYNSDENFFSRTDEEILREVMSRGCGGKTLVNDRLCLNYQLDSSHSF